MTTALQQLLAELDAAPVCCLDDVRRWVRTLAMEMGQMQEAVEDNARLAQHERSPVTIPQEVLDRIACEDCSDAGPCRTHSGVNELIESMREQAADDNAEIAMLTDEWRIARSERDAARAEVERLTRERDRAQDGLLAVSQERNRIERETVEAIAAWLYAESSRLASTAHTREACDRNQRSSALANAADSLRDGTWKEPRS